jgi:hypothetical protein
MKKIVSPTTARAWTVVGALALLAPACSPSSPGGGGTGGKSGGSGGSTATASGGATASSGGSTGSGGAVVVSSGGSTGSGGAVVSSGGSTGSGGATTSTGGSSTGGSPGTGGRGGNTAPGGTSGAAGHAGATGTGGHGGGTSTGSGGNAAGGSGPVDGGAGDVVVHDGSVTGGVYVRTGWTATYTCTGGACPKGTGDSPNDKTADAFDGNIMMTRWSTNEMQETLKSRFPLFFTVDMKDVLNVSKITMHPSCRDIFDAPGTLEVYLSTDGTNFGKAVVTGHHPAVPPNGEACPPTANAIATDTITFPTTPARYIQIKATETLKTVHAGAADRYWGIGEFNVYP